jgi:diaminohydroxyphosphoribosylaminopyrimidine deaminase / 5-amino-6-(5-phosphoribosylamino)uracil reductase
VPTDADYIARAIKLAARGQYTTDPNPRVGCVIVKDDCVIGEGWHERAGGPHAEPAALAAAGPEAAGATVYVSLEPCSSIGRTGACSTALISAGVERVVCSGIDPNPSVAGSGIERLREAGISVDVGACGEAAANLNPGYFSRMTRGRPWVRSKLAVTLDGRTALANGHSQWITGEAARADVHRWRARSSAVLTGIGTILADDPTLSARLQMPATAIKQPTRVILDSQLQTPQEAKVLAVAKDAIIFTTANQARTDKFQKACETNIERVAGTPRCDLAQVFDRLGELEFNEIWVEAGAQLNGSLIREGLIDELIIYMAPDVFGSSAKGMFEFAALASLEQKISLSFRDVRRVGDDLRIIAWPSTVASP